MHFIKPLLNIRTVSRLHVDKPVLQSKIKCTYLFVEKWDQCRISTPHSFPKLRAERKLNSTCEAKELYGNSKFTCCRARVAPWKVDPRKKVSHLTLPYRLIKTPLLQNPASFGYLKSLEKGKSRFSWLFQ